MSAPLASPIRRTATALWFLQSRSLVNQLRVRLKRLKQPKYLIGALIGIALFTSDLQPQYDIFSVKDKPTLPLP